MRNLDSAAAGLDPRFAVGEGARQLQPAARAVTELHAHGGDPAELAGPARPADIPLARLRFSRGGASSGAV